MHRTDFTIEDQTVPGYIVSGEWGVHRARQKNHLWVTRHRGTGLAVGNGAATLGWSTRKEAAAMASYLDQVLPETRNPDCEEFLKDPQNRERLANAVSLGKTMARCARL